MHRSAQLFPPPPPPPLLPAHNLFAVSLDPTSSWNGFSSMTMEVDAGADGVLNAAVTNRGLGNEGFAIEAGRSYEG
jgi:hypothetical protein